MRFEWDEEKNRSNIRKHGVSFKTAARIFDGPCLTWIDDRQAYAQERRIKYRDGRERSDLDGRAHAKGGADSVDLRSSRVAQRKG